MKLILAGTALLIAALGVLPMTFSPPPPAVHPVKAYSLGLKGLYCPTKELIYAQAYTFAELRDPTIIAGCRVAGEGLTAVLLEPHNDLVAKVDFGSGPVWVFVVQLESTVNAPPQAKTAKPLPTLEPLGKLPNERNFL